MKRLITIVCISSAIYGASDNEIASFDLIQQPIPQIETQLPPPSFDLPHKSTFLAVGLSSLFPGLGHVYLGKMETAGGIMASASAGMGLAAFPHTNESVRSSSLITVGTIWAYGVYAAYRDVRTFNSSTSYSYKMPTDTFADLTFAPFRISILKKPEVWGGFFGGLTIALTTAYFAYPKEAHIRMKAQSEMPSPLVAFPVGIGEEALFRGYLQSQLSEIFNPWVGIALSSLAFGAAHIPNAIMLEPEHRWRYYTFSIPLITSFGAYFGWLTYKNHSLRESVALHSWYDFTLFAASSLANHAAATGRPGFAIAIPF